jgi:hypothetical protein
MQIERSDEQPEKTHTSRIEIFEPDSNVTVARFWQPQKHKIPILSTNEGMQIDSRHVHA